MPSLTISKRVSRADRLQRIAVLQERDRRACRKDAAVFVERHCTIEDTSGAVMPFNLWPFQRDVLRALQDGNLVIVLKARRLGLSWVVLAYALWLAVMSQGIRILILCKTEGDASESLDRIRRMLERIQNDPASAHILADLQRPAKERDAVTKLDVGGSTIRALVGTPAAARSETAGLVLCDEFAFQRRASDIWRAILPTIDGGGQIAVVSTGNGASTSGGDGAEFASQWERARTGLSGFTPFFFPWMAHPERDGAWKAAALAAQGDEERFKVEFPETEDDAFLFPDTNFVFSGAAVTAAVELGRRFDEMRETGEMPPPSNGMMAAGVDWGDFRTHMVPVWELERGGVYVPPGEHAATQTDAEAMTLAMLEKVGRYDYWFGEERYDSSFKNTNRTFVKTAEALLGRHDPIRKIGRPNSVPVAFAAYKSMTVTYLRFLLRRTLAGETTRVLAISPTNTVLIEQMRQLQQKEDGMIVKGNDDAVDSLIAGTQPVAKRHRALVEDIG